MKVYYISQFVKKILICAVILVIFPARFFGQVESNSNIEKEIVALPSNKNLLSESLDEVKLKINRLEKKIKMLNSYSQSISDFKEKINDIDPIKIEQILSDLNSAIIKNKNDERLSNEQSVYSYLVSFNYLYYIPSKSDDDDDVQQFFRDFRKNINNISKPISENSVIKLILNVDLSDNPKPVVDAEKFPKLKLVLNSVTMVDVKKNLLSLVENEMAANKKRIETTQRDVQSAKSTKAKIFEKLNEQETQINDLAIKVGLPLFCLTILLLFLVPSIINKNSNQSGAQANSQNVLLEISTVLLLTMSILILGLSGKIQSDVLGTLIGGISGYVLNKMRAKSDTVNGNG